MYTHKYIHFYLFILLYIYIFSVHFLKSNLSHTYIFWTLSIIVIIMVMIFHFTLDVSQFFLLGNKKLWWIISTSFFFSICKTIAFVCLLALFIFPIHLSHRVHVVFACLAIFKPNSQYICAIGYTILCCIIDFFSSLSLFSTSFPIAWNAYSLFLFHVFSIWMSDCFFFHHSFFSCFWMNKEMKWRFELKRNWYSSH